MMVRLRTALLSPAHASLFLSIVSRNVAFQPARAGVRSFGLHSFPPSGSSILQQQCLQHSWTVRWSTSSSQSESDQKSNTKQNEKEEEATSPLDTTDDPPEARLRRRRSSKIWRRPISQALSVVGFVHSSVRALLVRGRPSQWRRVVRELLAYLQTTGLDREWSGALTNVRLLDNIRIQHRVEYALGDRRERAVRRRRRRGSLPSTSEALRYVS